MKPYSYPDQFESARLLIRKLRRSDDKAWLAYIEDEEATEFMVRPPGITDNLDLAQFWINRQIMRYEEQRYGLYALISKDTGAFVGQCGLLAQEVNGTPELEVGYHVLKKYWGQGYAPEAARLFRDHGFESTDTDSIVSIIHTDNHKSQSVAAKNGMSRGPQTTWMNKPIYLYRITRAEWEAGRHTNP